VNRSASTLGSQSLSRTSTRVSCGSTAGVGPILASLAGYALGVGVSYFGNSRFTFRRPALHAPQFVRFATISLTGLAINLGTVWVATHTLGWPLWLALVPVVLLVPTATFVMSKFWAFRVHAAEAA